MIIVMMKVVGVVVIVLMMSIGGTAVDCSDCLNGDDEGDWCCTHNHGSLLIRSGSKIFII